MNTKRSFTALSVVLLAATFANPAKGQWNLGIPSLTPQPEIALVENSYLHPTWQVEFCSLPKLLRMHCPTLPSEQGVLISRIVKRGPAAMCYELQVGDILLTANGEAVFGMASLPESPGADLTVMRGGELISIVAREVCPPAEPSVPSQRLPSAPVLTPGNSYGGASVSAYSSGNESVSVVQNGSEITLEMLLPTIQSAPIRFRGTRQQITNDVQNSQLPPAARQRVLQAIR